jgi:myo-inositol-1(or 4)-monophosphatase
MLKKFLKATIKANKEIYQKINKKHKKSWEKDLSLGAGGDISSGFDIFAEKIFIKHLKRFGKIDSEEAGAVGEGDYTIIIDPIDGSSNAKSYFPYFGSSVALKGKKGKTKVAVVCNFANGEIFYKIKKNPLMVGNLERLEFKEEKLTKKPQIGIFEKAHENYKIINLLSQKELKFRTPGAVALSLAYAHRVNFFLFIGDIREYDFAAGLLLCSDLKVNISKDYAIVTHKETLLTTIKDIISEAKR